MKFSDGIESSESVSTPGKSGIRKRDATPQAADNDEEAPSHKRVRTAIPQLNSVRHGQQYESSRWHQDGHSYGSIAMKGGNLHQGNNFYFMSDIPQQSPSERLLESLNFQDMDKREREIEVGHQDTFEWIFDSSRVTSLDSSYPRPSANANAFSEWVKSDEKIFWIAGKPGSGKSTLLKFICTHKQTLELLKSRFQSPDPLVLKTFFWLHGSEMQRSLKGMICSLLRQLLQKDEWVVQYLAEKENDIQSKTHIADWTLPQLRRSLIECLGISGIGICIFIDALDEMQQSSGYRELLNLIKDLSELSNVKICVSSRQEVPFEAFFSKHSKLRIHELTDSDINKTALDLLKAELTASNFGTVQDEEIVEMAREITHGAEGVFLWAILAIKSLVIGLQQDDDVATLLIRLKQLPREMHDLFERLWCRVQENNQLYGKDTNIIIHATHRMTWKVSILELTLADDERLIQRLLVPKIDQEVLKEVKRACDRMERRLFTSTAGLVELDMRDRIGRRENDSLWSPVHSNPSDDKEITIKHYPICVCEHISERKSAFRTEHPDFSTNYNKRNLKFIHRSAADFLITKAHEDVGAKPDKDFYRKIFSAFLACCAFGFWFKKSTLANAILDFREKFGPVDASSLILSSINSTSSLLDKTQLTGCEYGWSHDMFFDEQDETNPALDFTGLMSELGLSSFVVALISRSSPPFSAYYKGYLLSCAASEVLDFEKVKTKQLMVAKAELILLLVGQGADLLTPQLRMMMRTRSLFLPRAPLIDCWFFLLRSLMLWEGEVDPWPMVFKELLMVLDDIKWDESEPVLYFMGFNGHGTDILFKSSSDQEDVMILTTTLTSADLRKMIKSGSKRYFEPQASSR